MSVIPITLFFSLLLAGLFVILFARQQRRRFGCAERDSLLPLADETPREVISDRVKRGLWPRSSHGQVKHAAHDHDHADGRCACRAGVRPPCADCLRRRDEQEPAYF